MKNILWRDANAFERNLIQKFETKKCKAIIKNVLVKAGGVGVFMLIALVFAIAYSIVNASAFSVYVIITAIILCTAYIIAMYSIVRRIQTREIINCDRYIRVLECEFRAVKRSVNGTTIKVYSKDITGIEEEFGVDSDKDDSLSGKVGIIYRVTSMNKTDAIEVPQYTLKVRDDIEKAIKSGGLK